MAGMRRIDFLMPNSILLFLYFMLFRCNENFFKDNIQEDNKDFVNFSLYPLNQDKTIKRYKFGSDNFLPTYRLEHSIIEKDDCCSNSFDPNLMDPHSNVIPVTNFEICWN